jgi:uncharacterized membrane protein
LSAYFVLKTIHIASATVLFGTGLGIAFFKWIIDRTAHPSAIRVAAEKVVLADWLFTLPAIGVQAITGIALAKTVGYPLTHGWLAWTFVLFTVAGLCWIPVVWLQIRMRDLARVAERNGGGMSAQYRAYARIWFWLGVPAFTAVALILWLMVAKPA